MLLYFSATGNSKYVAARLSAVTGEPMLSISECVKEHHFSFSLAAGELLGVICPTSAWGLPRMVREFLARAEFSFAERPYVFFVATFGTTPGQTGRFADELLAPKGLPVAARFCVQMPDTWTPWFDLSDEKQVAHTLAAAEPQIDRIIRQVQSRAKGDFLRRKPPVWVARLANALMLDHLWKTKSFAVSPRCTGCGKCAARCPAGAIQMRADRPVWIKERCEFCLGCLHRCPAFAIRFGYRTDRHGQYRHPNVR